MKTFRNLNGAFGAAALLLSAMVFTACSSDDIASNVNPTYDGESVKTQFAINIPYAGKQGTRMGATETQEDNGFLGMYDIRLIPMTGVASDTKKDFTSILSLADITDKPDGTENTSWSDDTGFRKIYNDVNVPVETTNFLFYAAGRNSSTAPTTAAEKFQYGILTATVAGNSIDGISFALENAKGNDTGGECSKLIGALNKVINAATGWSNIDKKSTLGVLYTNFTGLKAGSANSICATLQSLYNAAAVAAGGPNSDIATAIQTAISGLNTTDGFTFDNGVLKTNLTYPQNMNMPDGAAVIKFEGGKFVEDTDNADVIPTGGSQHIKMDDICYPASIYYFVNTDLAANDVSEVTWPGSLTDWSAGFTTGGWNAAVAASTRTIALKKPIQYGVAKLKTTVKCSANSLEDSKKTMISVPGNGFPVTAVLVGGQPLMAKWDFHPQETAPDWKNVVYDKTVTGMNATTNASSPNYTLVLDNNVVNQTNQETVYIVIELTNNSASDFFGHDSQIIPAGGKFYLIAKLDPKNKTVTGVENPSVFMQDYVTTVDLKISSLKEAYNVIPDLRASQMQLGLAVDLDWKPGILFDVTIE